MKDLWRGKWLIKVHRIWKIDEHLWGLLTDLSDEIKNIFPGDYVQIQDKRFPILSVKRTLGAFKIEILADNPGTAEKISIIKARPEEGKFATIGPVNDWIIAGLRLQGYELIGNYKEADFVIVSYPEYVPSLKDQKVVFAPGLSSTWQDFLRFNEIFSKYEIGARYNLSKPILMKNDEIVVNVPTFSMKVRAPAKYAAYAVSPGKGGIIIGYLQDNPEICTIVYEPEKGIVIYSSLAMMIPYELLRQGGNNLEVLLRIIRGELTIKEEEEEKVVTRFEPGELIFSIEGLDAQSVFNRMIEKLSILGGLLLERDDANRKASFIITVNGNKVQVTFNITEKTIHAKIQDSNIDIDRATLMIRTLINDALRELQEKRTLTEKFKKIFIIALDVQEKLITVKDMIEVDMNPFTILEELQKIAGQLSADEKLSEIALDIVNTATALEKIIKRDNKLPDEIKNELLVKIENWINKLKQKSLHFI